MTLPPEPLATRRELDQLRADLIRMDEHGTRGVLTLTERVTDLIADVLQLRSDLDKRFEAHQRVHDQAERDRRAGRRWIVTTVIAALVCLIAILGLLLQLESRIR